MINPFKSKKGLGRGLSSLIGDNDIKGSNDKISVSSIVPNKNQPRKYFDSKELNSLINSMIIISSGFFRLSDELFSQFKARSLAHCSKSSSIIIIFIFSGP